MRETDLSDGSWDSKPAAAELLEVQAGVSSSGPADAERNEVAELEDTVAYNSAFASTPEDMFGELSSCLVAAAANHGSLVRRLYGVETELLSKFSTLYAFCEKTTVSCTEASKQCADLRRELDIKKESPPAAAADGVATLLESQTGAILGAVSALETNLNSRVDDVVARVVQLEGFAPLLESPTRDRVEVLEQEVAAWTENVGTLLTNQTQTFLGALSGLNEKLLDRVMALESDLEPLRRADSSVVDRICVLERLGATSLPTDAGDRKLCQFHPGCKHGSSCKFAHVGGLVLSQAAGDAESETDEEAVGRYEQERCTVCGYHPSMGCSSNCDVLRASTSDSHREFESGAYDSACEASACGATSSRAAAT